MKVLQCLFYNFFSFLQLNKALGLSDESPVRPLALAINGDAFGDMPPFGDTPLAGGIVVGHLYEFGSKTLVLYSALIVSLDVIHLFGGITMENLLPLLVVISCSL